MNFGLSDEQQMIVDTVRSFVENELYPHEAMVERERAVPRVHWDRGRAGRVDADPDHRRAREAGIGLGRRERSVHRLVQAQLVVRWILAREMRVARVEQDALLARGVVEDRGAQLAAVRGVHDERAHGARAVVDPDRERPLHAPILADVGRFGKNSGLR